MSAFRASAKRKPTCKQGKGAAASAAVAVLLALAGCGGDASGGSADETTVTSPGTTAAGTTAAETTAEEATTTEPTPTATGEPAAQGRTITITVVGGAPRGGIERVTVSKGERVTLVVRSDVADEVHVHGYDKTVDVPAGGAARLAFVASIPGRFEVELEERGVQIADVTVQQ